MLLSVQSTGLLWEGAYTVINYLLAIKLHGQKSPNYGLVPAISFIFLSSALRCHTYRGNNRCSSFRKSAAFNSLLKIKGTYLPGTRRRIKSANWVWKTTWPKQLLILRTTKLSPSMKMPKKWVNLINAAKKLVYFEFKFPVVIRRRNPGIFSLTWHSRSYQFLNLGHYMPSLTTLPPLGVVTFHL